MRVLLEGWGLPRRGNLGGVDAYWQELVPRLLDLATPDDRFVLLSAFLHPRNVSRMQRLVDRGATLRHWWADPRWLGAAGRRGVRAEWLAGGHDVVHAPEPVWPFRGRGRLVVTCHDLMFVHHPQWLAPEWTDRLLRGAERCREEASLWICDSESTRADLVRTLGVPPGRTQVVPLGVRPAFFAAGDHPASDPVDANAPYYLFLGSMEPKKNLPLLLEAYGLALERGLRSELRIAGRASWKAEAVQRAAEASPGLRERVRFLGFVPEAELPSLVARARALVLPSRFEGFGLPVVEAMAAGTPVLCSDRGSLPEVAGGAARLFDADDAEGLSGLLLELEEDAGLRENLRRKGRTHAEKFTWERCARETYAAYRRALELPA